MAERDDGRGPVLSIVVCTLSRPELLRGALASLARQTAPRDQFEVVVVDNGPSAETRRTALSFRDGLDVRYVVAHKRNLCHARNAGSRAARAGYVGYVDDDAKAPPDYVEEACKIIGRGDAPAIFGGKILPFYPQGRPRWMSEGLARSMHDLHEMGEEPRRRTEPPFLWGSNIIIRRDLLERLGGFRPQFGIAGNRVAYGDEFDVQDRLLKEEPQEEIWYFPQLVIYHLGRLQKAAVRWLVKMRLAHSRAYVAREAAEGARYRLRSTVWNMLISMLGVYRRALLAPLRDRRAHPYLRQYFAAEILPRIGRIGSGIERIRHIMRARSGRAAPGGFAADAREDAPTLEMAPECVEGLVSVIMPTHNRAWIIGEALESVREQTYRPI
ncbi:MAG: glycosyltransferase family 2 protein, partial [Planctomycetota bacterium]